MNQLIVRTVPLFLCLFLGITLQAQTPFQRLYHTEASIEVEIASASNGDALLVIDSFNDTATFFHRLIFQRLDADGTILQQKGFFRPPSFRLAGIHPTSDNGLLMMGTAAPPLTDEDSVFVSRLDANGDPTWTKAFQIGPDIHVPRGIIETNDGGFIVYGIFEDFNTFSATIFLVKIDSNGNGVWTRQINSQLMGAFLRVGGLVEAANGDLWLSGSTRFNSEGSWLAKLNSTGQIQSTTFLDTHNLTDQQPEPFALFMRANGELDIFYNRTSFQDGSMLIVLRTDTNGTPLQTRRYYLPHSNGGEVTTVRTNGQGGYLLSGYHFPNPFRSSGLAVEIAANDNLRWANSYGTDYIESLSGIMASGDGGYLMAGFADPDSIIISPSENGLFPWLLKTDGMGNLDCSFNSLAITTADTTVSANPYQLAETSGPGLADFSLSPFTISVSPDTIICQPLRLETLDKTHFSFYPNPTQGELVVELDHAYPGATLTLTDPLGRIKQQIQLQQQQKQVLILDGPAGWYFVRLHTVDGKRLSQKICKY